MASGENGANGVITNGATDDGRSSKFTKQERAFIGERYVVLKQAPNV